MAGGGDVIPVSTRAQQPGSRGRRGQGQKAAWLPLDIIMMEIAARSDAATLVRCAATCRDARRRIAEDPDLHGRLRLRDTERFVLPLLRGHLTGITTYSGGEGKTSLYMVDTTTAADATRLVKVKDSDETLSKVMPLDSRGGLVLFRAMTKTAADHDYTQQRPLLVCNVATRRRLALPPEPEFLAPDQHSRDWWNSQTGVQYVLLVGGDSDGEGGSGANAAVGRRFLVLKARLLLSHECRSYRRLLLHTFSSEDGAWSPCTEIPTPNLYGISNSWPSALQPRPLVVGDVVHWLCLTDVGSYVLMLHARAERVNETALPASFPRDAENRLYAERHQYLLATASAGGNPVVLVADGDRISAWEQSKHTKMWKARPQVVIEKKTILEFEDDGLAELVEKEGMWGKRKRVPVLLWFGGRSGAVLLRIGSCLLWLDLQSKKIVRCFSSESDRRIHSAEVYCPYEVDLSSWVPTFSNAVTL